MKHKDELLLAAVFAYVKETNGVEPDYPFAKEPDMPVLRHRDTRKWFGIIQSVAREKLGLPGEGTVQVLNLKCSPLLSGSLRTRPGILPGYHMNKDHWITILLDGSADDALIRELFELSYDLTKR